MIYQERKINRQRELDRQQEHWNEVHENLLAVQKKSLEISDPNDADEKEADAVARKVVEGQSTEIHGTGGTINRKGEGTSETTPEFQSKLESNKGSGQSLDDSTKSEMESKMGADFSGVKIHTGSEAHSMSESINAKAFTHGQDVFFKQGEFNTDSKQGKELLAHELTHTVQQSSGKIQPKIQRTSGDGSTIQGDLAKQEYQDALDSYNIGFFIDKNGVADTELGLGLLDQLAIKKNKIKTGKMTVLQAGALAYDFGMLKMRKEYITSTRQKGLLTATGTSALIDEASLTTKSEEIKNAYDKSDKGTDAGKIFEDAVKDLVIQVFNNPDMPIQRTGISGDTTFNKKQAIEVISNKTGKTLNFENELLDKNKQAGLTADIKSDSDGFFKAMLAAGWVDISDISKYPKGKEIKMPDQFLAAVGDLSTSKGLADSDPSVGVGYFMYDPNNKQTTGIGGVDFPIYNKNELNISFDPGDVMDMRISAYGFDKTNTNPTYVRIFDSTNEIVTIAFSYKNDLANSTNDSGVTLDDSSSSGSVNINFGKPSTIIKNYKVYVETKGADQHDEVQIQISTTGHIAQTPSLVVKQEVQLLVENKIGDLHFDPNKALIKDQDMPVLDNLVKTMNDNKTWAIQIQGHTDDIGDDAANQKLSDARAKAVMDYVVAHGIAASRLTSKGFGELKPIADNKTEDGRAKNRRVIFVVTSK